MDFAIAVCIWIAGIGMSLVGIEMTIHPPNEKTKWWYRRTFSVLVISVVIFSGWQFKRAEAETARRDYQHQQEELANARKVSFMQGQLEMIKQLLGELGNKWGKTQPGLKELVAAISSISLHEKESPASLRPGPYSDWPTAKFRDFVKNFANELRQVQGNYEAKIASMEQYSRRGLGENASPEDVQDAEKRFAQTKAQEELIYQEGIIREQHQKAINVRDELLLRLKLPKPPEPQPFLLETGQFSSPKEVADYLENLARLLS